MSGLGFFYRLSYLYLTLLLILFFSGYYLTSFNGSNFNTILRVLLLFGFVFALIRSGRSFLNNEQFFEGYRTLLRGRYKYIPLILFYIYILISSVFFSEWAVFRRTIVLLVFLMVISYYSFYLRFNYKYLIYTLGMFGFLVGSFYIYNYIIISDFSFLGYRSSFLQGTGLPGIASYDNSITAALHISFLSIAIIWSFFNSKRKLISAFYYVAFFILLAAIVLTFARTALAAVFIGLLVFFLYELKSNRLKVFILYGVLLLMGVIYFILFYSTGVGKGLTGRDDVWIGLLSNMSNAKDWVFGVGPAASVSFVKLSNDSFAVHAHNLYIETIYRNGVLGLLLFLSLFFVAIRTLVLSDNRSNVFFIAILSGAGVAMFFDYSNLIYTPNLVWLWVWFPVAVSLSVKERVII